MPEKNPLSDNATTHCLKEKKCV